MVLAAGRELQVHTPASDGGGSGAPTWRRKEGAEAPPPGRGSPSDFRKVQGS